MNPPAAHGLGIDLGASRTKVAWRPRDGDLRLESFARKDAGAVDEFVRAAAGAPIGVTGCGSSAFAAILPGEKPPVVAGEFDAWTRGGRTLLERAGLEVEDPFLLVSLGTGTSMLRVEGLSHARIGGTALGDDHFQSIAAMNPDQDITWAPGPPRHMPRKRLVRQDGQPIPVRDRQAPASR